MVRCHRKNPEMPFINVNEAKTNLSSLLARVEAGEEIVIARNGNPVARLVPFRKRQGTRRFGRMKEQIVINDCILKPLPEAELAAWEG